VFVGLDLGTTNVKALLVRADGRINARASAPVGLYHVAEGGVEQDIEEIWRAALTTLRALGEAADLSQVRALGVSAQGGAMQLLDARGRPVGRVISWLDARGRAYDEGMTRRLGREWFAERIGHASSGITVGQVMRLRDTQPDVVRPPNGIGYVGDVIVGRLCGRRVHDATSLSLAYLYNPSLGAADPEVIELLEIEESQLPVLLPVETPAGGLGAEAARAARLPAGIPVSGAVHDQYAAAVGAGAVGTGDVMFGAGTAWVLLAVTDRLVRPVIPGAFVCSHPVAGFYGHMTSLVNGGSAFGWAVRLMGLERRSREELDALMESVPAGSAGLRFHPFMAQGGAAGADGRRAGLMGLQLPHGQGHVLRAVAEGLVMELGRYLRLLEDAALPLRRLLMCGGAAASRVTPQMVADTAGLPVAAVEETEVSALGAAVIARTLAEPEARLPRAIEEMRPPSQTREPGAHAGLYRAMLDEYAAVVTQDS